MGLTCTGGVQHANLVVIERQLLLHKETKYNVEQQSMRTRSCLKVVVSLY